MQILMDVLEHRKRQRRLIALHGNYSAIEEWEREEFTELTVAMTMKRMVSSQEAHILDEIAAFRTIVLDDVIIDYLDDFVWMPEVAPAQDSKG